MEAAESLAAIAAVVEEVALLLNQHAALVAGEQADREMIGEGAGGEPYRGFFTERGRHRLFELGDHSAEGVIVGLDRGGQFLEERGILCGRVVNPVTAALDDRGLSGAGGGASCGGENGGRKECPALHMRPRVSR
jgi:hypothetical protein